MPILCSIATFQEKEPFQNSPRSRKLRLTIPSYSANIIIHALSSRDVALLNYYSYNSFKA